MRFLSFCSDWSRKANGWDPRRESGKPKALTIFHHRLAFVYTASMNFLGGTRLAEDKAFLAVYPLFLFYFVFSWMIMIQ